MKSIALWAFVGLAIGAFWVVMSLLFFTAPEGTPVQLARWVAAATCPPFLFSDLFVAPLINAVLYGVAAKGVGLLRGRARRRQGKATTP